MQSQNSYDARDKSRRITERRKHARRVIEHAFGSEQWVKAIQSDYLLWPKADRRSGERRLNNRRMIERRAQLGRYRRKSFRPNTTRHTFDKPILSAEEKSLLRDLYSRS